MARPKLITVTGTYLRPDGDGETGTAEFTSSTFVHDSASDDVMSPGTIVGELALGELSVQVPASDDPAFSPVGWLWHVTLRLGDRRPVEFDAVIPYDAPGDTLDLSDLLPSQPGGSALYAPYSHTHPDYLPLTGGTLSGNLVVQDVGADKSYGLRVDGSGLDFNGAGADLFIGVFEGAGNTGPQRNYLRLEKGVALAHAIGRWIFVANADTGDSAIDIDPDGNKVTIDAVLEVGTAGLIRFGAAADANLYRVGPDYIATDGKVAAALDIECWTSSRGLVLHDRVGGAAYRLKVTSGVLGIEAV